MMLPTLTAAALAVPLRGIEATAKLLASHAVEDCEGAGTLLLEYVAEIHALLRQRVPDTGVTAEGGLRRNWDAPDRNAAVFAAVITLDGWALLSEIDRHIAFPPHLDRPAYRKRTVRLALDDLIAEGRVERRRAGQKEGARDPYQYRAVVPPLRAAGGAA